MKLTESSASISCYRLVTECLKRCEEIIKLKETHLIAKIKWIAKIRLQWANTNTVEENIKLKETNIFTTIYIYRNTAQRKELKEKAEEIETRMGNSSQLEAKILQEKSRERERGRGGSYICGRNEN